MYIYYSPPCINIAHCTVHKTQCHTCTHILAYEYIKLLVFHLPVLDFCEYVLRNWFIELNIRNSYLKMTKC